MASLEGEEDGDEENEEQNDGGDDDNDDDEEEDRRGEIMRDLLQLAYIRPVTPFGTIKFTNSAGEGKEEHTEYL